MQISLSFESCGVVGISGHSSPFRLPNNVILRELIPICCSVPIDGENNEDGFWFVLCDGTKNAEA